MTKLLNYINWQSTFQILKSRNREYVDTKTITDHILNRFCRITSSKPNHAIVPLCKMLLNERAKNHLIQTDSQLKCENDCRLLPCFTAVRNTMHLMQPGLKHPTHLVSRTRWSVEAPISFV